MIQFVGARATGKRGKRISQRPGRQERWKEGRDHWLFHGDPLTVPRPSTVDGQNPFRITSRLWETIVRSHSGVP